MRIHRLIASVYAVCLVVLITGLALADGPNHNEMLKGKYRFSMSKTCTDTATGSTVHLHFHGTTTYDGSGNATLKDRGTVFLPGPFQVSFEETAELTYEVRRNGSFTQEGAFTATDGSFMVTGVKIVGQLDSEGSVLILSAAIPAVQETLTFPGGGSTQRFCAASGTAVRIRPE
ncbi:MAG: hypothetical protein HP492_18465 [Nitrospira sp.]|nr:hypothetical protein [Nitrospira sp.]MBH0204282.1 hypothetical protein [Nitrospira sp.]